VPACLGAAQALSAGTLAGGDAAEEIDLPDGLRAQGGAAGGGGLGHAARTLCRGQAVQSGQRSGFAGGQRSAGAFNARARRRQVGAGSLRSVDQPRQQRIVESAPPTGQLGTSAAMRQGRLPGASVGGHGDGCGQGLGDGDSGAGAAGQGGRGQQRGQ